MPLMYYGPLTPRQSRLVLTGPTIAYNDPDYRWARIEDVVPDDPRNCLASYWQWVDRKHTILAWRQNDWKADRVILLPGLLKLIDALTVAREAFPDIIPSPIVFRVENQRSWLYE